jgi:hypothetical protein
LIRVEDLWLAASFKGNLQSLQAELHVKAVAELPAEHMPGEESHHGHQRQESLSSWSVGDIGGLT